MRRALPACFALVAALAPAPAAPAAGPRAGSPPPAAPAAGTESDSGTLTVYLPQPPAARPATRLPAPPRGESGLAVGLAAALFAAVGLAWLGLRPPLCPRCRQKLVRLERSGSVDDPPAPAAGVADRPIEDFIAGGRRDPWACLGCGIVMRRRFGPLVAREVACPSCGSPTKKTQLTVVDRPGYLTWGEVRLDESCLTCSHRTSALYAAPPLEAPTAQRGTAHSARGATASRPPR